MPNWVNNGLSVSGEQVEIDKFKEFISKPYETRYAKTEFNNETKKWEVVGHENQTREGEFLFWNIKSPEPEILANYFGSNDVGNTDPNHWYSWNISHWGTKWEASDSSLEEGDGVLYYTFNTAWSPPSLELFGEMSEKFPTLNFYLEYEEEQGWGGEVEFDNGVISSQFEYDIPTSHADYEERGKADECLCTWGNGDGYDDCPPNGEEINGE
jgi:hypothetical protein